MKKYNNNSNKAVIIKEETKHLFPIEIQRAFDFFQKNKNEIFLPEKFYASLSSSLKDEVKKLWEKKPDTALTDVVTHFIGQINKNIPGDKILEITALIINTWEKLKQEDAVLA